MIITVDGVEYNATPIAEEEIATGRTVVKDGVAYQLSPLPVINKVQVNGVVYDIEDTTIGKGLRYDDNGAIEAATDGTTIRAEGDGVLKVNLGSSLTYSGGVQVALDNDCVIGTSPEGRLTLRVGTGLIGSPGTIGLALGSGLNTSGEGNLNVLIGSGLKYSYDKIIPALGSGLVIDSYGGLVKLSLNTELTDHNGSLGIRLDSFGGLNRSGLEKADNGLRLKSTATLVDNEDVAPIVMDGSNYIYGIEITDAVNDTPLPVMSKAVKSALKNLSRARSLVASKETLSSGETLALRVPQCFGTMTVSLSAGIGESFNGLLLSVGNATISVTRSLITVSVDGEDVTTCELPCDDAIGTLDNSTLTLEFTLSRFGNELNSLAMENRPLISSTNIICRLPWPTSDHLDISVSGNLNAPCLSCAISSGKTLIVSNQRTSMSYARKGMTLAGYAAMTSSQALALLKGILALSRPETAVWYIDSADSDLTYTGNAEAFIAECDAQNVTPVICTIPSTPTKDNAANNRLLRAMPCRVIDLAAIINGSKDYATANFDHFNTDGTITDTGIDAITRIINSSL